MNGRLPVKTSNVKKPTWQNSQLIKNSDLKTSTQKDRIFKNDNFDMELTKNRSNPNAI